MKGIHYYMFEVIMMENLIILFLQIDGYILAPKTSLQNGIVKRKNCTSQEMIRTMLNENSLLKIAWLLMLYLKH